MRQLILLLLLISISISCAPVKKAEPRSETPVAVIQTDSGAYSIAFSPDGKWIATIDSEGYKPALWEVATGRKVLYLPQASFPFMTKNARGELYWGTSGGPQPSSVLAFASDSRHLAAFVTTSDDASYPPLVWNIETGKAIGPWIRQSSGQLLLAGTKWASTDVRSWYTADRPSPPKAFPKARAISANGLFVAQQVGTNEAPVVEVWNVKTNRVTASIPMTDKNNPWGVALEIAFNPDGSIICICTRDLTEIWKLNPVEKIAEFPKFKEAINVKFSPDGQYLLFESTSALQVLRAPKWNSVLIYKTPNEIRTNSGLMEFVFSPDGQHLAAGGDRLFVWDLQAGRIQNLFGRQNHEFTPALAASPDGTTLAVARAYDLSDQSGTIDLWPLTESAPPRVFAKELYTIKSLAFSHDSRWLGAASQIIGTTGRYTNILKGEVHLWRAADGSEIKLKLKNEDPGLDEQPATNVAFSPDDKQLIADLFSPGEPDYPQCEPGEHCGDPETVPYHVRSTFLDISSGREINSTYLGETDSSQDLQYGLFWLSPNGRRAFVYQLNARSEAAKFTYINTLTGKRIPSFRQPPFVPGSDSFQQCNPQLDIRASGFVAFAQDMQRAAISNGQMFAIFDLQTGFSTTNSRVYLTDRESFVALIGAFSPDGGSFALSTCMNPDVRNGNLQIYDASTLKLRAHANTDKEVLSLAFTSNNKFLFTGSYDGVVRMWNAKTGSLTATLMRSDDGEWIVFTPERLFDASAKGAELLGWRMNGRFVSAVDLPQFRRQGLLAKLIAGEKP